VLDSLSYIAVNHWMVERLADLPKEPEGFITFGDTLAHASARIALDARFVGPALIGPDVRIEEGATIVGPVSIGAGCHIGRGALVSRSVLWTRCEVGDRATVDRSILADGVAVPPGTQMFSEVSVQDQQGGALGKAPRPWSSYAELLPPTHARLITP
jgi:NDP-sugar pyrophosphorylase family protein